MSYPGGGSDYGAKEHEKKKSNFVSMVLTFRNEKEKEEAWKKIIEHRIRKVKEMCETNNRDKDVFERLMTLEFGGGECWMCGIEWEPNEFDSKYLKGKYYTPQCECYTRCPECKQFLYDLQFLMGKKLVYCDNCHFPLRIRKGGKTECQFGNEFEIFYNGLNRKQQLQIMFTGRK